uniref:CHHC U11-48K-type domain-containing protein n=1 Tax=Eptatretus burgeri TaxID=7764 RepID=A0A8C4N2E8_EPTBU
MAAVGVFVQRAKCGFKCGYCDPDETFPCPYDPHHLVRASRFPYHIVQCRKNNPHIAKRMKACPFNARHIILKTEMERHVMRCPDKTTIAQDLEIGGYSCKRHVFTMMQIDNQSVLVKILPCKGSSKDPSKATQNHNERFVSPTHFKLSNTMTGHVTTSHHAFKMAAP